MISENCAAIGVPPCLTDYFGLPMMDLFFCRIGVVKIKWTKSEKVIRGETKSKGNGDCQMLRGGGGGGVW